MWALKLRLPEMRGVGPMNVDEYDDMIALTKRFFAHLIAKKDMSDMISPEVEFFFPGFGVQEGITAYEQWSKNLHSSLELLDFDVDNFSYIAAGSNIVVEGTKSGRTKNQEAFRGLRFCAVFDIRGSLIERLYVYTDPQFV